MGEDQNAGHSVINLQGQPAILVLLVYRVLIIISY